jgi:hypothetical protein
VKGALARTAAVVALIVMIAVCLEAAVRLFDGFQLFSLRLTPHFSSRVRAAPPPPTLDSLTRQYVASLPVADGVRREWYVASPVPLPHPPLPPELAEVFERIQRDNHVSSDMFKQWNARLVQAKACANDPFFRGFPGFAFSFDPVEPTLHPPYRFLPSVASPYGLVTNRFGFRGHEIAPDKPANVIRIAIAGASTASGSHRQLFSYPELIEPWLNLWAADHAPGVRFEVINLGREGISSTDIAAIVRQEAMPLEPDVILYHEGGNQFTPRDLIKTDGVILPPPAVAPPLAASAYFAVMRRVDVLRRRLGPSSGAEPAKPPHTLAWPASVDEAHPNPDSPALPLHLTDVVHDLDDIRRSADTAGARFVISSFPWMVKDGLVVDPVNFAALHSMLNVSHWPASYAEIKRLVDFQTRVFGAYAVSRGLAFVDVQSAFPLDPVLFTDAVHMTEEGDRLRAWIMFQGLVPIVSAEIAAHRLPRADRTPYVPPPIPQPLPRTSTECDDFAGYTAIDGGVNLSHLTAQYDATVAGQSTKRVVTPPGMNAYAAEALIGNAGRVARPGGVRVRLRVLSGRVAVGVLDPARARMLNYRTIEPSAAMATVHVALPSLAEAGSIMITNAVGRDGERSVAEIIGLEVMASPTQ